MTRLYRPMLLLLAALCAACEENLAGPLPLRPEALPYLKGTTLYVSSELPAAAPQAAPAAPAGSRRWFTSLLYGPLHDYGQDQAPAATPAALAPAPVLPAPVVQAALLERLPLALQDTPQLQPLRSQGYDAATLPLAAPERTALWVQADYALSEDASRFRLHLRCALTPPRRAGNQETPQPYSLRQQFEDAAYRADLSYVQYLPGHSVEARRQAWQQEGRLQAALQRGAQLLAQSLAQDLRGARPAAVAKRELVDGEYAPQMAEDGEAKLFRLEDGSLRWYETLPSPSPATSGAASS